MTEVVRMTSTRWGTVRVVFAEPLLAPMYSMSSSSYSQ